MMEQGMITKKKRSTKSILFIVVSILVSVIILVVSLFPLVWMILSSFKTQREVSAGAFLPSSIDFFNYQELSLRGFWQSLGMTFLGAIISMTGCIVVNTMAAYAFARMDFYLKKFLWACILLPMFVPGITLLIPLYLVAADLSLLNSLPGLILPGVAQAVHVFFMRQFFLNIPNSLEEAVALDGAGKFRTFIHLFLPLSVGPIVILAISAFLGYWNAFMWPAMIIDGDTNPLRQVMQVIYSFNRDRNKNWPLVMAGSVIATAIPFAIYLVFQKQIVESLKISGIK